MRLIAMLAIAQILTGCSVFMAASGEEEPDLGAIKIGSARSEVELHLGSPKKSSAISDGRRHDIYEYQLGNEPSTGRAIAHGTMDLLTLGLWEIAGTPMEGLAGDKYRLAVTYDEFDRVAEMSSVKAE